jgi:hypothetical protein
MLKAYAQDLSSLLEESAFSERKAFLRSSIKRIEVDKKKLPYTVACLYHRGIEKK